jgi:cystathionine beta-lyase
MQHHFDQVIDRRAITNLNKWKFYPEDVLPLWVADMDFRTPEPILTELRCALDHGILGYELGSPELSALVAARLKRLYGWQVEAETIVPVLNVAAGYRVAASVVCTERRGVLVQPPVFHDFLEFQSLQGLTRQEAPLRRVDEGPIIRYALDLDAVKRAIHANDAATGMFLLCNPHNPVGHVFTPEELRALGSICAENDILLCSDDIHNELILDGAEYQPAAAVLPQMAEQIITFVGPGKGFNVSGLGCAFAVIPHAATRQRFTQEIWLRALHPSSMGLVAARGAYSGACEEWLTALRAYLTANRDFLAAFVQEELPGMRATIPEATYLGWLDCREYVDRGVIAGSAFEFFLKEGKVALIDGATCGPGGEGCVRINFATPRVILEEALGRMKQALARAGAR